MKLKDKVAVITGGNSGIGLATAQGFINEGARVVIFGRNQTTLDEAAQQLGKNALAVQGDVARLADLDRLYATVQKQFGKVDIVVVNAGIAPVRPLAQVDEEYYDRLMNINVKGAFFTVQKALPVLSDGASIILVTSGANVTGFPNMTVYGASKAALRSLARTFSSELVGRGIRVNALSPGPIETPIFGKMELPPEVADEFGDALLQRVPMKRIGDAEEIASAMVFLASADSSYVLGAELVVDGGLTQL
jgi:NAD(P)-dependent dehydrogenase (short-subunit alcohol dehydrogenase family)